MPTTTLEQVVAYIAPSLKKQALERIHDSGHRMSMSAYIESLMKRDLNKRDGHRNASRRS